MAALQYHGLAALAVAGIMALQSAVPRFVPEGAALAAVLALAGLFCQFLRRTKWEQDDLTEVRIDGSGLVATTHEGKEIEFGWSELKAVRVRGESASKQGLIEIEGRGLRGMIREAVFPGYGRIRDVIRQYCEEKHVSCEYETGAPPLRPDIEAARTIIQDNASFNPQTILRIIMFAAYSLMFIILLATWGQVAGCIAVLIIWTLLAAGHIYMPDLLPKGWLKTVLVTEAGLSGETFAGEKTVIPWDEVSSVRITFPQGSRGSQSAQSGQVYVQGRGAAHLKIGNHFARFGSIAVEVAKICGKKDIDCSG
jgi:hypothetical protein